MWIDIEDDESKEILIDIKDDDGNPTDKLHIFIPVFELYSEEVGEGSGRDRVLTFAYEIWTFPTKSSMLKIILCQVSQENILDLKFIPYGLDKQ